MNYEKLVNQLVKQKIIKPEDADIYIYGLKYALLYLINIIISAFLALLFHGMIYYIVILLLIIPLRRFAGGFHFNNSFVCFIFSQLCVFLPQIIIPYISGHTHELILIFTISFILLFFTTSKKKSISSKKRYTDEILIQKYTRKTLQIELLYLLLFILCIFMHFDSFAFIILYIVIVQLLSLIIPER